VGKIIVNSNNQTTFNNNVDYCVGTGRLGLALTEEYLKELKFVQDMIGFSYIRGHGLFSDDVAIYQEYEEDGKIKAEYNYTYIDRIFDRFLELGIRPYLELGFMPEKLASGTQTIFYWKGNTTPPKDYKKWTDMVIALLEHLKNRYGKEVTSWPIEVWNEPNLPGFWYKADMEEYFKLFKETFLAIKAFDSRFKVGGPAICGVRDAEWIKGFLDFCKKEGICPDRITRHHYTVEFPERIGHYDYSKLEDSKMRFENLQSTRDIVDSYEEFKGLPIHLTEFSTSYTPRGVIHDTNLNAAYLARQLSGLGDVNEAYSYWTFGDVFEEQGVQNSLFHGGFGMVAAGNIPKPTFWTFYFFKQLKLFSQDCVYRDDNAVIVKSDRGYAGILWNIDEEDQEKEISFAFGEKLNKSENNTEEKSYAGDTNAKEYTLVTKTVDETCCNPLKLWHDLGEPAYPTREETELIKSAAWPLVESSVVKADDSEALVKVLVRKNGVLYFTLTKRSFTPDRGYDYDKVVSFH
jgi:xylan 1,4-beta-xylosidase